MNNIYLIGMMGSGKSVTGKALAKILNKPFIDLDDLIQKKAGKTIPEIFKEEEGEKHFRHLETQALLEASRRDGAVIATGGGTVLLNENVELMKTSGSIVYLEASIDSLWNRVKHKADRPLLAGGDGHQKLVNIYDARQHIYKEISCIKVNTDGLAAEVVAQNINKEMENK